MQIFFLIFSIVVFLFTVVTNEIKYKFCWSDNVIQIGWDLMKYYSMKGLNAIHKHLIGYTLVKSFYLFGCLLNSQLNYSVISVTLSEHIIVLFCGCGPPPGGMEGACSSTCFYMFVHWLIGGSLSCLFVHHTLGVSAYYHTNYSADGPHTWRTNSLRDFLCLVDFRSCSI